MGGRGLGAVARATCGPAPAGQRRPAPASRRRPFPARPAGGTLWRSARRTTVALLLGLLLSLALPPGGSVAATGATPPHPAAAASGGRVIPIEQQPFYPELLQTQALWADAPLQQVMGDSPHATLLNFYVVMHKVDLIMGDLSHRAGSDPGSLTWSPAARERIEEANRLFADATNTLDTSAFPASIRANSAEEAAIQLKQVLDYVFNNSRVPIHIPGSEELRRINAERSKAHDSWTIPGTEITLTSDIEGRESNRDFYFSAQTVSQIDDMFQRIHNLEHPRQPFSSPSLYNEFAYTPGGLVPPKWYVKLPSGVRRQLDQELLLPGQSRLQVLIGLICLLGYGLLALVTARSLLRTSQAYRLESQPTPGTWSQDSMAWRRVALATPLVIATWLVDRVIDDHINFTGAPLSVSTNILAIFSYLSLSALLFFLCEAIGRSVSEWLVLVRGGGSALQLRRAQNLVMPVSRVLGGILVVALAYKLLLDLGLPPDTVLAFSAVPGLAIGLGASKLLGNLFAGLSIQTDKPLRVGEFCQVGDNLGFVSRIGLRSLEIQTLQSRVTIPNAIADDQTIINYSVRTPDRSESAQQILSLRLQIDAELSPSQREDLLLLTRTHLASMSLLQQPLATLEQLEGGQCNLNCVALAPLHDWPGFLAMREALLLRLLAFLDAVKRSSFVIGVSYDTTVDQRHQIPIIIADLTRSITELELKSCLLLKISDYSYDYMIELRPLHTSHAAFRAALDRFHQGLLQRFAEAGIDIPFPTACEIALDPQPRPLAG